MAEIKCQSRCSGFPGLPGFPASPGHDEPRLFGPGDQAPPVHNSAVCRLCQENRSGTATYLALLHRARIAGRRCHGFRNGPGVSGRVDHHRQLASVVRCNVGTGIGCCIRSNGARQGGEQGSISWRYSPEISQSDLCTGCCRTAKRSCSGGPVRWLRSHRPRLRVTLQRLPGIASMHPPGQSEWASLMGSMPSHALDKGKGDRHPIYYVSHAEATEFCRKLTDLERKAGRLPKGWEYRLPTDAQWEYACRAGTTTATAFGDKLDSTQANFNGDWPHNGAPKGPNRGKAVAGRFVYAPMPGGLTTCTATSGSSRPRPGGTAAGAGTTAAGTAARRSSSLTHPMRPNTWGSAWLE